MAASAQADTGHFMLVRRDRPMESVLLVEVSKTEVVHRDASDQLFTTPLGDCVALIDPDAKIISHSRGLVRLTDGQELPGEAVSAATSPARALMWNHALLGRVQIPLQRIESVVFAGDVQPPSLSGPGDVILLTNGDRVEGLIESLSDPMIVDTSTGGEPNPIELQMDRVAAVRLVSRSEKPAGQRVWLIDGTVIDVEHALVGDDRLVRLVGPTLLGSARTERVQLFNIAAVLFEPTGMTPLATLKPTRVDGPPTRYVVPEPSVGESAMPLGLSDVKYRGPLTVRYAMPATPARFLAEVRLPGEARAWGDCELIILDDDRQVVRQTLNAANPSATINATLRGSQLTIRLEEGANGPIQDTLIFSRAMLLAEQSAR